MQQSRLDRLKERQGRGHSRLRTAGGFAVLILVVTAGYYLRPWEGTDWWIGKASPAVVDGSPTAPVVQPSPSSLPPRPLDPALEPYRVLLKATDLVQAQDFSGALSLLTSPPPDGYQLYLFHTLRAKALQGMGTMKAARAEAESAHALVAGPERVESGVLLADLRQADGDSSAAFDLLAALIPSGDLLFLGPLRAQLLDRLPRVVQGLQMSSAEDRERLMSAGDLFFRYGMTGDGVRIFQRRDWPEPISPDLAYQQIRSRAFMGETDQAILDLERLAGGLSPANAAWYHSLRAAYLQARGRPEEAKVAFGDAVATNSGTFSGGQAVYRVTEPLLDADQVEASERLITAHAPVYSATSGWRRAAWELFASAYATNDIAAARRALTLLAQANDSDPQYLYWGYRVARESGGDRSDLVDRLLIEYPYSYYAEIARERWPQETAAIRASAPDPEISQRLAVLDKLAAAAAGVDPVYRGIDLTLPVALWRSGYHRAAAGEVRRIANASDEWDMLYLLSRWEAASGKNRESISVSSRTSTKIGLAAAPQALLEGLYPRFYRDLVEQAAAEHGVDPYFVFAIIREESAFEPGAHSSADARGLMQIIPATGLGLAQQAGLTNFVQSDLFKPEVAIPLGVRYLASLLQRFNGDTRLAAAAYNGGQNSVDNWISITPRSDMSLFVERIPFPETRNYVKTTDRSYRMYKLLYD